MTFCIWGRSVELLIDPLTLVLNNQVRFFANLLCDVGVRYPAAEFDRLPERSARRRQQKLNARFCRRETAITCRDSVGYPKAVKKFIIAAVCLSATLASNASMEDKRHIQAAQDPVVYQGAIMRFPNGNGFIFSIGTFRIIVPPLIVRSEALTGTASRVNQP
jgi:hypothetical protein